MAFNDVRARVTNGLTICTTSFEFSVEMAIAVSDIANADQKPIEGQIKRTQPVIISLRRPALTDAGIIGAFRLGVLQHLAEGSDPHCWSSSRTYNWGSLRPATMAITLMTAVVASAQSAASRKVAVRRCCKATANSSADRACFRAAS